MTASAKSVYIAAAVDGFVRVWDTSSWVETQRALDLSSDPPLALESPQPADRADVRTHGSFGSSTIHLDATSVSAGLCIHDAPVFQASTIPKWRSSSAFLCLDADRVLTVCAHDTKKPHVLSPSVAAFDYSVLPDGSTAVAALNRDGTITVFRIGAHIAVECLLDTDTLAVDLRVLQHHDGSLVVATVLDTLLGSRGPLVSVWDADSGEKLGDLREPEGLDGPIRATSSLTVVHLDRQDHLVTTDGHAIMLWDAHTLELKMVIPTSDPAVIRAIGGYRSETTVAAITANAVVLINVTTGEMSVELPTETTAVVVTAIRPDASGPRFVVGCEDGSLLLWRPQNRSTDPSAQTASAVRSNFVPRPLVVGKGGTRVIADAHGWRWEFASGTQLEPMAHGRGSMWLVGRGGHPLFADTSTGGIQYWDPLNARKGGHRLGRVPVLRSASVDGVNVAVSLRGKQWIVWDVDRGKALGPFMNIGSGRSPQRIAITSNRKRNGHLLVVDTYTTVDLWDVSTGRCKSTISKLERGPARRLDVLHTADGEPWLVVEEATVRVFGLDTEDEREAPLEMGYADLTQVAHLDAEGDLLIVGAAADGSLHTWYPQDGRRGLRLADHHNLSAFTSWRSSNGTNRAASGTLDGRVRVWDTHSGALAVDLPLGQQVDDLIGDEDDLLCVCDGGMVRISLEGQ